MIAYTSEKYIRGSVGEIAHPCGVLMARRKTGTLANSSLSGRGKLIAAGSMFSLLSFSGDVMIMCGDNSWCEEDFLVTGSRGERSGNRGDRGRFRRRERERERERTRTRRSNEEGEGER